MAHVPILSKPADFMWAWLNPPILSLSLSLSPALLCPGPQEYLNYL